jgi:aldo/keto reductase family protein
LGQLREIVAAARIKPAVVQVESHPYLPEWDLFDFCREQGIVLLAFAALGHGLDPKVVNDPLITAIAQRVHKTPAQVALAWAVQRGTAFLTTSTTPRYIRENFEISTLPEEAMRERDGITTSVRFNAVVGTGVPGFIPLPIELTAWGCWVRKFAGSVHSLPTATPGGRRNQARAHTMPSRPPSHWRRAAFHAGLKITVCCMGSQAQTDIGRADRWREIAWAEAVSGALAKPSFRADDRSITNRRADTIMTLQTRVSSIIEDVRLGSKADLTPDECECPLSATSGHSDKVAVRCLRTAK